MGYNGISLDVRSVPSITYYTQCVQVVLHGRAIPTHYALLSTGCVLVITALNTGYTVCVQYCIAVVASSTNCITALYYALYATRALRLYPTIYGYTVHRATHTM